MYAKIPKTAAAFLAFLLAFLSMTALISCSGGEETKPSPAETPTAADTLSVNETTLPDTGSTPAPKDWFEISEEEAREMNDSLFLQFGISYPRFKPGKEGEAHFFGRWFEKEIDGVPHRVTTTDGAQLYFMTDGCTEITLDFTVISALETPYFAFSVDGSEPERRHVTDGKIELPDAERHLVTVIADGLTEREDKWKGEIGFALRKILVPEGGRIREAVPQNKTVAFFGDSITEGIAALAGAYTADQNSATASYPWFCAKELGVLPYFAGYGGSGVTVKGSFGAFYLAVDHLSADRTVDGSFTPDLIVINHGYNDLSSASSAFRSGLKKALARLQKTYPGVPVVYMIPFNGSHKADIQTVCADYENITIVDTDGWRIPTTDGIHPNRTGAQTVGKLLAAALTEIYGKEFFA